MRCVSDNKMDLIYYHKVYLVMNRFHNFVRQ